MAGAPILLGTASWADRPLIQSGEFYPSDATTPEERLRYYATKFPLVEADTTYAGRRRRWCSAGSSGHRRVHLDEGAAVHRAPAPVARLPEELQAQLPAESRKEELYREDADDVIDYCWSTFIDGLLPCTRQIAG
jgi:hypothetical protein